MFVVPTHVRDSSLPKHVSAICGWSPLRHFTTGSQLEVTLHFIMEMFPFMMNTHLLVMFLLDWPGHKAGKYLPCKSNLESIRNRSEFWLLFSDHWPVAKVLQPELTSTNIEWMHGCPPPYPTFKEPAFVQVEERKESNPHTLVLCYCPIKVTWDWGHTFVLFIFL